MLSTDNRVFFRTPSGTLEYTGRAIKALAASPNGVWALDTDNNLLWRHDKNYWVELKKSTPYVDVFAGPNGIILGIFFFQFMQNSYNHYSLHLNYFTSKKLLSF